MLIDLGCIDSLHEKIAAKGEYIDGDVLTVITVDELKLLEGTPSPTRILKLEKVITKLERTVREGISQSKMERLERNYQQRQQTREPTQPHPEPSMAPVEPPRVSTIRREIFILQFRDETNYVTFNGSGYIRSGSKEQATTFKMDGAYLKIMNGTWKGYYVGASGDHGYVMAYKTASNTIFDAETTQPQVLLMDNRPMSLYDGYYYCSNRWKTVPAYLIVEYV